MPPDGRTGSVSVCIDHRPVEPSGFRLGGLVIGAHLQVPSRTPAESGPGSAPCRCRRLGPRRATCPARRSQLWRLARRGLRAPIRSAGRSMAPAFGARSGVGRPRRSGVGCRRRRMPHGLLEGSWWWAGHKHPSNVCSTQVMPISLRSGTDTGGGRVARTHPAWSLRTSIPGASAPHAPACPPGVGVCSAHVADHAPWAGLAGCRL